MNGQPQDPNGGMTGLSAGEWILALLIVLSGLGFLLWNVCAGLCPIPR
jgi:hypothetical protein